MRRLAKRIRATAQRHIALTLAFTVAIIVVTGGLSLAALSGAFNAPAPVANTYTFSADWTLLDLERHIEAGEVATISLVAVAPGAPASATQTDVLAARTTSGQWVRVTLAVSPNDALVALRSLGYGRLIAADSVAQLPSGYGTSGSGSGSSDPMGGIVQLAMLAAILAVAVAVVFVRRTAGQDSGRGAGSYHVIPPSNPNRPDGDSPAVARPVRFADVAG
ncbi:MAG: hypothetical protein ABSB75_07765, partial [Candidatus Limnocylindrales bacterium]